jgi:hypothetical protein
MTSKIDAGGPALPPGITLRDYFAAHAPIVFPMDACEVWEAMSKEPVAASKAVRQIIEEICALRWIYADAMIKARPAVEDDKIMKGVRPDHNIRFSGSPSDIAEQIKSIKSIQDFFETWNKTQSS